MGPLITLVEVDGVEEFTHFHIRNIEGFRTPLGIRKENRPPVRVLDQRIDPAGAFIDAGHGRSPSEADIGIALRGLKTVGVLIPVILRRIAGHFIKSLRGHESASRELGINLWTRIRIH